MNVVVDASVALCWCLPDESDAGARAVLEQVMAEGGVIPPIFDLEVCNILLVKERKGSIPPGYAALAIAELAMLPLEPSEGDPDPLELLELARSQALTAYDASNLWAAQREGIPLATLDKALRAAAPRVGVELFN